MRGVVSVNDHPFSSRRCHRCPPSVGRPETISFRSHVSSPLPDVPIASSGLVRAPGARHAPGQAPGQPCPAGKEGEKHRGFRFDRQTPIRTDGCVEGLIQFFGNPV